MKPQTIGRVLGVGTRLAGRAAGAALAGAGQTRTPAEKSARNVTAGRAAGQASRGVVRGVGGFLRPFGRVGGILWLEVMGVFFLLPVVVFTPTLWRVRASWLQGPDHRTFVVTAAVIVIFFYLSVTSFVRAGRK